MKIELYYNEMGLPRCIRVKSEKLQLDHTFFPFAANPGETLDLDRFMSLLKEGVFSEVKILPEHNDAYIRAPEPEGKMYLNDWINLSDFSSIVYTLF